MLGWMFAAGVLLLILCAVDVLSTVLWLGGGQGFLTARLTSWCWRALKTLIPRRHKRLLGFAGPFIILLTISTWILLLWGGWILVFASEPGAVRHAHDARAAQLVDLVYFVGYTLFTLGMGDWVPARGMWQIATAIANATGMLFITLFITYVISVMGAVVQKRALANHVHGMGPSPGAMLTNAWTGRDFQGLDLQIQELASRINLVTEQHYAYPILHYYHAPSRSRSSALAVAKLDEALLILSTAIQPQSRPPPSIILSGRSAVSTYLGALKGAFIARAPRAPPAPDLQIVREAKIPVDAAAFEQALLQDEGRRRLLLGAVVSDGWSWDDVLAPTEQ